MTSLLLPGTPTSSSPPDCFALKVNAKVGGESGEGIVVGARCSPSNRITQYWVQKANGERFWATFQELKTTVTAPASTHIGLCTFTFSSADAEPHAGLVLGGREVRSDLRGRGWITA